jgi:hypothetical protein
LGEERVMKSLIVLPEPSFLLHSAQNTAVNIFFTQAGKPPTLRFAYDTAIFSGPVEEDLR